jgi:hypothetical protein
MVAAAIAPAKNDRRDDFRDALGAGVESGPVVGDVELMLLSSPAGGNESGHESEARPVGPRGTRAKDRMQPAVEHDRSA